MEQKTYEMFTETQILFGITNAYLAYCTNKPIKVDKRKMSADFTIMRNVFKRDTDLVKRRKLYEYAIHLTDAIFKGEKRYMTLSDFYKRAEAYYQLERSKAEKAMAQEILKDVVVPVQRKYTFEDLMKL